VIPTVSLGEEAVRRIEEQTAALALELGVVGLMNVQYAVQQSDHGGASIYVLEVNPRGSRTVPFVSKATGVSLARVATRVIAGHKLRDMGLPGWEESLAAGRVPSRRDLEHVAVKEAVLPFPRFPGVDTTLGPEMKSTGEVMGVGASFPEAFAKASLAAGDRLPREGTVFISVADAEKDAAILMALMLSTLGFRVLATEGTHRALTLNGIASESVLKHTVGLEMRAALEAASESGVAEGAPGPGVSTTRAHASDAITTVVDLIEAGEIDLVINIPRGRGARSDGYEIRRAALRQGVPTMTNAAAAHAAVQAIAGAQGSREITVTCLQDIHSRLAASALGAASSSRGVGA
jgi:carbamoyl-phosphate synthase large subunit